jgi:hypothetical protein
MVCGKPLYFFKSTVVSLHFHCISTVCICSVVRFRTFGSDTHTYTANILVVIITIFRRVHIPIVIWSQSVL